MGPNDPFTGVQAVEPEQEDGSRTADPAGVGSGDSLAPGLPPFGWRLLVGFSAGILFGALVLVLGMGPAMTLLLWGLLGVAVSVVTTLLLRFDVMGAIRAGLGRSGIGPSGGSGS